MEKKFTLKDGGYEVTLGKFANQADGAVWIRRGGTVVLSTAVSAPAKEFPGFLPLTVDYRELFSAAGKIPGGYFKREGKMTDKEVLTARLIDRALRPLFPSNFFDQVQILSTVYSVDKENMPYGLALIATSLALNLSKIPFSQPVGYAEVARIQGKWVLNPTYPQSLESDLSLVVVGTEDGICMVEGSMQEISESEFVDILFMAYDELKKQVVWQKSIIQEMAVTKEVIVKQFDWSIWKQRVQDLLPEDQIQKFFNADKLVRNVVYDDLKTLFLSTYKEDVENKTVSETFLKYIFDETWRSKITALSFKLNKRFDLRDFDTVRPISIDVGLLPCTHGSALFTRGRTQALATVTLAGGEEFKYEGLMEDFVKSNFMLHYNFPSFSVGEVRPSRGPGRRDIGHGHLAASAITKVLPDKETFPYLMRIVSDILESDGSSSMATVCGSTMALMDAGVPIKKPVSGVAMGLLENQDGSFKVLTDISGNEDAFGSMDFKVAGTVDGILAIQMDIKSKKGFTRSVFEEALAQARKGRLHILNEMQKALATPRSELSLLVPRFATVTVPKEKIGAIIGTGGKIIKEIIEKTGTTIDIEESGLVKIFGQPGPKMDLAISWVKLLGGLIDIGSRFNGKVLRVADFGLIVELIPGVDGMVHVSVIQRQKREESLRDVQIGDSLEVEVMDYDMETGRIRLKLV